MDPVHNEVKLILLQNFYFHTPAFTVFLQFSNYEYFIVVKTQVHENRKGLENQFHPIVAHTNKNWPYFVQLGTVARSRVCLGSKWGRWQSKPWVTTPFDAIFVKFMHTPSFFSFQTGAVKGVDRFTISRFQLLLNSKIHGNNRGPFRTEIQGWESNPNFYSNLYF